MLRRGRKRIVLYGMCALLSLVAGAEASVVLRESVAADELTRDPSGDQRDRDARPLPLTERSSGASHIDPRLSRVATRLGRGPAEVRCWSDGDWETLVRELDQGDDVTAYTTTDRRQVHLPWHTCMWLGVAALPTLPRSGRAEALAVFAHELEHLRGVDNEARAECFSYQHVVAVAEALGTDQEEAGRLRLVAWRESYPPSDPEYVSTECRNGGRLDLHPTRRRWP